MKLTFFLSLYLFSFKVPFFSVCHWNNKNKTADTSTLLNLFFIRWHDWLCVTFLHQINTDYRSEFARCLEPLLLLGPRCPPSVSGSSVATRWDHLSECLKVLFLHRRSPPEYRHAIIRILPNESKKKKKKKVWAENFTLAKDPNSKSPNGLRVQMADSNDCSTRKGGAELSRTMAVILSALWAPSTDMFT